MAGETLTGRLATGIGMARMPWMISRMLVSSPPGVSISMITRLAFCSRACSSPLVI